MAWITIITQINKILEMAIVIIRKKFIGTKHLEKYGIRHSWSENCVLPSERCWHTWSVGVFTYFSFPNSKLSLCSEKPVVCIKYIFFRSPPNLSKVIYAKFTLYLLEIAISEFSLPWISIFFPATSFLRTFNFRKIVISNKFSVEIAWIYEINHTLEMLIFACFLIEIHQSYVPLLIDW